MTSAAQRTLLVVVLLLLPFDWASQVEITPGPVPETQAAGEPSHLAAPVPLAALVPPATARPRPLSVPPTLSELAPPSDLPPPPPATGEGVQHAGEVPTASDPREAPASPPRVVAPAAPARTEPLPEPLADEPAPDRAAEPTRVIVPAVGASGPLVPVGLHPDRTLVVPDEAHVAGWYTGAPRPGVLGPAVIVGHNTWGGRDGVFLSLHRAGVGDVVEVHHDDGSVISFRIYSVEQYRKDAFPTQRVYGNTDRPELRVITCGGPFDRAERRHLDNIVVFAHRI